MRYCGGLLDISMLDELSYLYITIGDQDGKKAMSVEANFFESDINECISKAQTVYQGKHVG